MVSKTEEIVKVGITGHQNLEAPSSWEWVRTELDRLISNLPQPLIGISSLARGADQLFADAVLQHSGMLEVIVPFESYESTFADSHDREAYVHLLGCASRVDVLKKGGTDQEAYLKSGKMIVSRSELVIAVWDGKPAAGLGGTGDIVQFAVSQRKRIVQINPITRKVIKLKKTDRR